jgi:3-hydroxybutyryl-CoA dehydrogenase
VFEDLDSNSASLPSWISSIQPEAILATNTSSISIAAIAAATKRGDKVIGMHFFNPVPVMQLVEYVPSILTSLGDHRSRQRAGREALGKTGVLAKDSPGFIVNRLLVCLSDRRNSRLRARAGQPRGHRQRHEAGRRPPHGPADPLADFIGLDIIKDVADVFFEEYGESRFKSPPLLTRMVTAGQLGRKSGQGLLRLQVGWRR